MSDKERKLIEDFVLETFHYEHDLSTQILARLMLLCELLIEKGILEADDVMKQLGDVNLAMMLKEINYGDDTWNEDKIRENFAQRHPEYDPKREI